MMGWQSHQLDHMQIICTSLQTDNHTSTSSLSFYRLDALPCRPTNSVKSLKAQSESDASLKSVRLWICKKLLESNNNRIWIRTAAEMRERHEILRVTGTTKNTNERPLEKVGIKKVETA